MLLLLLLQVNSAKREGDQVVLEVEPAKGGETTSMTVDVVLVSAGEAPAGLQCSPVK